MVGGTRERQRPWRETAATLLTAKQYFQIATVYESAAADTMTVPRQQRAAFIRKARWFHMLARIKAAKEAAAVFNGPRALLTNDAGRDGYADPVDAVWGPKPKYLSLEERLNRAKARATSYGAQIGLGRFRRGGSSSGRRSGRV